MDVYLASPVLEHSWQIVAVSTQGAVAEREFSVGDCGWNAQLQRFGESRYDMLAVPSVWYAIMASEIMEGSGMTVQVR